MPRTKDRTRYYLEHEANSILAGGGDFGGIDFSKLGGGAGLGGEEEEEEDDEDDDDMPPLEGEEDEKPAEAAKTAA